MKQRGRKLEIVEENERDWNTAKRSRIERNITEHNKTDWNKITVEHNETKHNTEKQSDTE